MKVEVECPHCKKPYYITDPQPGDKWDCPHCNERAVINKVTTTTVRRTNDNAFSNLFG